MGGSVTSIGGSAFYNCYKLVEVINHSSLNITPGSSNYGYVAYYAKILVDDGVTSYKNDGYEYTLTEDNFLFRCKDNQYELIAYCGNEETVMLPGNINDNEYEVDSETE